MLPFPITSLHCHIWGGFNRRVPAFTCFKNHRVSSHRCPLGPTRGVTGGTGGLGHKGPGTDEPETLHNFQFAFMELSTCCHLLPNVLCKSAFTFMVLINLVRSLVCQAGRGRRWGSVHALPAEAFGFGMKPISDSKIRGSHEAVV